MDAPNRKEAFFLFYNPSVSSADSSLYTREPNGRDDLGEGAFRDGGPGPRGGSLTPLCRRGGGLSPGAPDGVVI